MPVGIVNKSPQQGQDSSRAAATTAAAKAVAGAIQTGGKLFANLPASPALGQRDFITNCNTIVFLAVAAGGGANKVPVVWNGAQWLVG